MFRRALILTICFLLIPLAASSRGGHSASHKHGGSHSKAGKTSGSHSNVRTGRKAAKRSGRHYYGSRTRLNGGYHASSSSVRSSGSSSIGINRASYGRLRSPHVHYRTGYSFRAHSGFGYNGSIVHVSGYYRRDGTWVNAYERSAPLFTRLSTPIWFTRDADPFSDVVALPSKSLSVVDVNTSGAPKATASGQGSGAPNAAPNSSTTSTSGIMAVPGGADGQTPAFSTSVPTPLGGPYPQSAAAAIAYPTDDLACPAASPAIARLRYLTSRSTAQARAQIPEVLDKAYDAELSCTIASAESYIASDPATLRAALFAKLRLALLLSWDAQYEAQEDVASAHETLLEALDLSRFVFDATAAERDLTGVHSASQAVDEEIVASIESLRRANPELAADTADDPVEDADRVVRTQTATRLVEAFLDQWERRSRQKTFDGADVIEAVDGSTTVQIRTSRDLWLSRSSAARRETVEIVVRGIAGAVTPGPLGYVLKLVADDGGTLLALRIPGDLSAVSF